ncbi:class I SAM-dependent methyltransferase [Pseudomonas tohonis]|nr:hypothetical protein L682_16320 [Pseudomonas alcaligenes OT 69]MDN4146882.1 class I SAM-dependent methyltransferase [Pseudomonas tohonis]
MTPAALDTLRLQLTAALGDLPTETRRLFHGRGRRWPGLEHLVVDWLEGVVQVALFREPEDEALAALKTMLAELVASDAWRAAPVRSLLLQRRYLPGSETELLWGEAVAQWTMHEDGLVYRLDLMRNQNIGLFLDMRYGRCWVREQAAGKRVLNLFAYTCGFSVAALAGGAAAVVNLDMARAALSRGRDNHRLNGHDLTQVMFLGHELFKSWGKVKKCGPYDLVIIDPPSFQKGSFELDRDYRKILRRLPELLAEGGQVLACVNDPATGADFIVRTMAEEAPGLAFRERLANPPEFEDVDPEGGLKALVFTQGV